MKKLVYILFLVLCSCASQLNDSDQQLLDTAMDRTQNAASLRFNVSSLLRMTSGENIVQRRITVQGTAIGLGSLEAIGGEGVVDIVDSVNNETTVYVTTQIKYIDGELFLQADDRLTGNRTRWIATPVSNMFGQTASSGNWLPQEDVTEAGRLRQQASTESDNYSGLHLPNFDDVLNLFGAGSYITTSRVDESGDQARFVTDFDIIGIIDSGFLMQSIVDLLEETGDAEVSSADLDALVNELPILRQTYLPEISLTIERYVDTTEQQLSRIEIDFDALVQSLNEDGSTGETDVQFVTVIAITGYGGEFEVLPPTEDVLYTDTVFELTPEDTLIGD